MKPHRIVESGLRRGTLQPRPRGYFSLELWPLLPGERVADHLLRSVLGVN